MTKIKFYIYPMDGGVSFTKKTMNGMISCCKTKTSKRVNFIRAFLTKGAYKYQFGENDFFAMLIRIGTYDYDNSKFETVKHNKEEWDKEWKIELAKKKPIFNWTNEVFETPPEAPFATEEDEEDSRDIFEF